ncbi:MAG: phosphate transport system regulatory protein PhoU [Actinomyces sp.]|nr:MAG: phosphate transport system regulatory protein PhoU [Actinomyces sp.]
MDDVRRSFHAQLDEVRARIVQLAAATAEAVPRATEALLEGDLEAAQYLIDGDDRIDALALEVEEKCYRILALQQPMASDLRSVLAAMWITSELERSADLAANICKACRRIFGVALEPRLRGLISEMSEEATRLLRLAVDAYVDGDAGLAAALDDIDDRLDSLHTTYIQAIFESQAGGGIELQPAVQLALIGRFYERIGDHAVNIGERIRYMVDGWLPEHTGAAREHERERLRGAVAGDAPVADVAADGPGDGPPGGSSA